MACAPPPLGHLGKRPPRAEARSRDHERGSATASFVIVFPLVVLVFMAVTQWGLYFHSQSLVDAAAQDGTRAAQNADGTPADGQHVAKDLLADAIDSGLLRNVVVDVTEEAGEVRTTVRATAPSLVPLPGFDRTVEGTSVAPKEQFIPQGDR